MKLREILKLIRIKNAMTQTSMAKLIGIDISAYSKFEKGLKKIPSKYLQKISEITKLDIRDVIMQTDEQK